MTFSTLRPLYIIMILARALLAADDPGGWAKAKWGMTPDQVQAAVPEATSIESMPAAERTFVKGEVSTLGILKLDVAGTLFQVFFRFDKANRLYAVRLSAPGAVDQSLTTFEDMEALLIQKYGRPFERSASEDGIISHTALWTFPATTITLRYSDLRARVKIQSLSLEYSRPSPSLDKL